MRFGPHGVESALRMINLTDQLDFVENVFSTARLINYRFRDVLKKERKKERKKHTPEAEIVSRTHPSSGEKNTRRRTFVR